MVLRALLVDDHAVMRKGVRSVLEALDDVVVVGEASNGRDAVELARRLRPELCIVDVSMPDLNGVDATCRIIEASPATRVLALSALADSRTVAEMLRAGASGFVVKTGDASEIVQAVQALRSGLTYLSPEVAHSVVEVFVRRDSDSPIAERGAALSAREREVLQLIAEGHSTKEIADALCVSPKTIESHRKQIMCKLGIHSVAGLTKYAVRAGLTALER